MKATFALMVVAVGLALFVIYDQEVGRPARDAKHEDEQHVLPLREQKLDEIVVKNGDQTFRFQCLTKGGCEANGSGSWNLTEPVQDKADDAIVGSLAATVKSLVRADTLTFDQGAPDPKEFGFSETALSVELKSGKNDYTLTLGKPVPVGANVYAITNVEPNKVSLVDKSTPSLLKQDLFHWRNKRLFPAARPENITQLSWRVSNGAPISAQKKDLDWNLTSPVNAPANDTVLDGLTSVAGLSEARSIFAGRNTPEAKKLLAGKPVLQIDFVESKAKDEGKQKDGRSANAPRMLHLNLFDKPGAKAPTELVADAEGAENLSVVDATPFKRFRGEVIQYRNRKLFPNEDLSSADRMELKFPRGGNQVLVFHRKDNAWKAEEGKGEKPAEPYSQKRLESFFQALNDSEVQDFLPLTDKRVEKFGREPMDLEVKVGDKHPVTARFLLSEHQFALTDGIAPKEVRRLGTEFLKVLPIRVQDLYESANQRLVTKESDGNDAAPGNKTSAAPAR